MFGARAPRCLRSSLTRQRHPHPNPHPNPSPSPHPHPNPDPNPNQVLPDSVNAKVNILGPNYMETLRADLSEEALQWVGRNDYDLCRAPHDATAATTSEVTAS